MHRSYTCKTTFTALFSLTNVGQVINCVQSRPVFILWMTESVQIVLKGLIEANRSVLSTKNHCIGSTSSMFTMNLQKKRVRENRSFFNLVFVFSDFFFTAKTLHTSNSIEETLLLLLETLNMQHTYMHMHVHIIIIIGNSQPVSHILHSIDCFLMYARLAAFQ